MEELPRIKVTVAELTDPRVDEVIAREAALPRRPADDPKRAPGERPHVAIYYNPIVVYPVMGGIAAFMVWRLLESGIAASERAAMRGQTDEVDIASLVLFPLMGAAIGLFIAMTDALLSRNVRRAAHCGIVGLGVGLLGGVIGLIVGSIVFGIAAVIVAGMVSQKPGGRGDMDDITGMAFFVLMGGRAVGWTIAASGMGVGQGVALKSKKLVLNGLIGGLMGGFLGGLAFDPINKALSGTSWGEDAGLSRMFGFVTIGVSVGLFTGLVESMARDAWLYMKAGPLAGKEFVIYRDPTVLGSSPKCDVYLFKDAAIEPQHAEIRALGARYQLVDLGTKQGVYVNGRRVDSQVLESGDTIVLGETVLQYVERETKK